jgi:hypothetical protein
MNVRMKKAALGLLAGWTVLTLTACLAFADMPRADRGHMGHSNTAALGMVPVGNGAGFEEQNPPNDCPLMQDSGDDQAFACWSGSGDSYDFTVPFDGPALPGDGQIVYFPIVKNITCADDFAGSVAKADEPSTGTAVFTIKKNGSTVGTVTFTTSDTGVWATSGGATSYADGDIYAAIAPSPQDATLAGVGLTHECERD